jgi:hypothetical protein
MVHPIFPFLHGVHLRYYRYFRSDALSTTSFVPNCYERQLAWLPPFRLLHSHYPLYFTRREVIV